MVKQSKSKKKEKLCVDNLRHAEYYEMQETFDSLYAKSKKNKTFTNLMDIILSKENILLAYRNIKANTGSNTPGTDKTTIKDIGRLLPEDVVERVRFITTGSVHGYRPKPVRRKEIPKPNGKIRPLGIPCMWDRLIQQCIKQVIEPICEAKFSENSYGFRPNRSVEHAIAATYKLMQRYKLNWIIEFDIEGFFDNVNHSKLIRQIWAMGIHDKHLIYILLQILKAPIKMPDGSIQYPTKGTPQGGIISPLLANIVLNELDHWVESQWQKNPVTRKYSIGLNKNGSEVLSSGYHAMRKTGLKEMYIVRYADDFRIFCRTKDQAERTKIAVTKWLSERLKLKVSEEKTKIVNAKSKPMEFLGFKIRLRKKGQKYVVRAHMSDKALKSAKDQLTKQAKNIAKPRKYRTERDEVVLFNQKIMGIQNYYQIATDISLDCSLLNRRVMTVLKARLKETKKGRLKKSGRKLTEVEEKRYGPSKMLRYEANSKEPIYPIGYVKCKNPMSKKRSINSYTSEGRVELHDNLQINTSLMHELMKSPSYGRSAEFMDNRISLFSAQWGKCAITGKEFRSIDEIHCHHILPKSRGGTDKYENLVLVSDEVHRLIHAVDNEIIKKYLKGLKLNKGQLGKINVYRQKAGLEQIAA